MKRYIHSNDYIFGMANITPKRTDLPVHIWSDHGGIRRKVSHNGSPRAKIGYQGYEVSVSIEEEPRILAAPEGKITKSTMKELQKGIDYIARNYDLFLRHYMDTADDFDDQDLFDALRSRGDYR